MQKSSRFTIVAILLALLGVFALSFSLTVAQVDDPDVPENCGEASVFTLWAEQTNDVGTVTISNDEDNLYVTFNATGGWLLADAHVGVGTEFADISDANGEAPSLGQLPYIEEDINADTATFMIPLTWDPDSGLYVVAHAAMYLPGEAGENPQEETAFGGDEVGPGDRWWFYMQYMVQECEPDEEPGGDGCSHGYWKTHPEVWSGSVDLLVGNPDLFGNAPETFASLTWLQALSLQGGPGVDGAIEILLKQAVAAMLNAIYTDFEMGEFEVNQAVNAALASDDRDTILELAELLDDFNNGDCVITEPDNGDDDNGGDDNGADIGNNGNPQEAKVMICHIPSGNPTNAHQITVGASAVPAHLAHGDVIGDCPLPPAEQNPPGNSGSTPNSNNGQGKGRP